MIPNKCKIVEIICNIPRDNFGRNMSKEKSRGSICAFAHAAYSLLLPQHNNLAWACHPLKKTQYLVSGQLKKP